MNRKIVVLPGDGVGPEITAQAVNVLERIADRFGHRFEFSAFDIGGIAYDRHGTPLPQSTLDACKASDSVLLGAVGGPKWDNLDKNSRPEKGLLGIRNAMGLYANLRPATLYPQLSFACPLKPECLENGIDVLMVRELTGGIYFGAHETSVENGQRVARDVLVYSESEIERIVRTACEAAMKRNKRVVSVDKANVLDSSRLWREVAHRVASEFPEVVMTDMLVDTAAMQLVRNPSQFDVIVTENMFGDILSDEASMIVGSIGMMPSASLGVTSCGMYEPIHGSAPDIAGQDKANPIGTILSAAMMLRYSFSMPKEADAIESAVKQVLDEKIRTADIFSEGCVLVGCSEMGYRVSQKI